jgi:Holliday junction resolvasome RuvABC DNA-binding subunit
MSRPTRLEINCETGEQTVIELTDEEIAQMEADQVAWEAEKAALEAEAQAKAEARASGIAKLMALGLTEEEAQALVK